MNNVELMKMTFKESYDFLKGAIAEGEIDITEATKILTSIKKGTTNIRFDLRYYFNNHYELKKGFIIFPNGKMLDYTLFMDELESREIKLKKFIIENYQDKSVI